MPNVLEGEQLHQALREAMKKGVVPLELVEAQSSEETGDKNHDGGEHTSERNEQENTMSELEKVKVEKNAKERVLSTEDKMSLLMSHFIEKAQNEEPFLTIATQTPLPRLALESAVKTGILCTGGALLATGLRYTVFRKFFNGSGS